jgi:hypothetical protein
MALLKRTSSTQVLRSKNFELGIDIASECQYSLLRCNAINYLVSIIKPSK